MWQRMYDQSPSSGAVLFGEGQQHILLLHDHDESEKILPGYYRLFLDHLLENGVVFDEPKFL